MNEQSTALQSNVVLNSLTGLGCPVLREGEGLKPRLGVAVAEGGTDDTRGVLPCSSTDISKRCSAAHQNEAGSSICRQVHASCSGIKHMRQCRMRAVNYCCLPQTHRRFGRRLHVRVVAVADPRQQLCCVLVALFHPRHRLPKLAADRLGYEDTRVGCVTNGIVAGLTVLCRCTPIRGPVAFACSNMTNMSC